MGNGACSKLKCPNGYDKTKFNIILKLYDILDSNGDQVVDTSELKDISKLHVKNRISELNKLKKMEHEDYNYKLEQQRLKHEKDKLNLEYQNQKDIEKINNAHVINDVNLINKINDFKTMDEKSRCNTFLNVVSKDGKHIDFWKFFDYMKNRTGDIKNIQFS